MTLPASTMLSNCAKMSFKIPPSSALTSTDTLSVSMVARSSPFATGWPTFLFHSTRVPSVMLSAPKSLTLISTVLAGTTADCGTSATVAVAAGTVAPASATVGGTEAAAGAPIPLPTASFSSDCPLLTLSSAPTSSSVIVPDSAAFTSMLTLSVSISASNSPLVTTSPTCFLHSTSVPSVIDSAPKSSIFCSKISPLLLQKRRNCC
mmetsp:Transcript_70382/g.139612  ORF Transcript_70382/g.139612 Transcript_70382/m.139612 type:complete len:206 (+) Transcript_70382:1129-1746(+)